MVIIIIIIPLEDLAKFGYELVIKCLSLIIILYVLLHNENQEKWIWKFLFLFFKFSLLVIETLQIHFFFQNFIFDFTFWWIFNNTKSIAENPIVKHLEKFHNVFEGHLISLNIPMLLLLLCGYLIFLIISTSSFLKILESTNLSSFGLFKLQTWRFKHWGWLSFNQKYNGIRQWPCNLKKIAMSRICDGYELGLWMSNQFANFWYE